jgi:GntR family transcriptional regulator, transcriptional repressor for pyruvate dehydrogenase complex
MFKSIKTREPLSKKIVADIEEAIRSKKIPVNGQLPSEKELCVQFNVSRTVLREALKILGGMGLLTMKKGKGVFVNEITTESVSTHIERYLLMKFEKQQILEVHYVREIIEPSIVSTAALSRSDEDIEKLQENLKRFSIENIDYKERSNLDGEFHLLIAKATRNSLLPLILEPIYNVMYQIRSAVYPAVSGSGHSAIMWHKKILDAIIKKNSELAQQSIIKHLEISREHTKKLLASMVEKDEKNKLNN